MHFASFEGIHLQHVNSTLMQEKGGKEEGGGQDGERGAKGQHDSFVRISMPPSVVGGYVFICKDVRFCYLIYLVLVLYYVYLSEVWF